VRNSAITKPKCTARSIAIAPVVSQREQRETGEAGEEQQRDQRAVHAL